MHNRDKLYTIYALRCINNSRLYIGRTSNLENRIQVHFQELKSGRHTNKLMLKDFEKYGRDNFEVYILEENVPYEQRTKEYEYMRKYNTFEEKYGYNHGDKGKKKKKTINYIYKLPFNNYELDIQNHQELTEKESR